MFGGKGTFNYDKLEKGYELPVEYTFQCKTRQTCEKLLNIEKRKLLIIKKYQVWEICLIRVWTIFK